MTEFDFDPDDAPPWIPSEMPGEPEPQATSVPTEAEQIAGWGQRELLLGAVAMLASGAMTLGLLVARSEAPAAAVHAAVEAPVAVAPPIPTAPPTGAPAWEAKPTWLGGSKGVAYETAAESSIDVWMRTVRPALVVRCMDKQPEVFIFTGTAAAIEANTQDHTVTVSLDGEMAESALWPDSSQHDALFASDGNAMARRLLQANMFTFGFTPHNAPPVTVRFRTAGLRELLQPYAKHCGWE